jgi:hypothetical protein
VAVVVGATEEYVDRVVDIVSSAVPRLQVSVRPVLEVEDVSMIVFEHPEIPSMELIVATDAAFVKVLVSRYVFDTVPLDDLANFAERLYTGRIDLHKRRILRDYRLRVETPKEAYEAVGPGGPYPLEEWEVNALAR